MSKYRVGGIVKGYMFVGVYEANSPEEAMEMANDEHHIVTFCHQCNYLCEDAWFEANNVELVEDEVKHG